jgi:hypothetical protein
MTFVVVMQKFLKDRFRTKLQSKLFRWPLAPVIGVAAFFATPSAFAEPSGAFCLFTVDEDVTGAPEWNDTFISGFAVRVKWSMLEPAKGTYSWAYLDAAVAKAQATGKKVAISVIAGCDSPQWVFNAASQILALTGKDAEAGTRMPAPWDTNYLAAWTEFISNLGARYGGLPAIAYFTATGLGHTEECYLDAHRKDAPEFQPQAWLDAARQIVTAYTAAAKGTPFVVAWGKPAPGQDGKESGCMYQVYSINTDVGFKADSLSSTFPNLKFLEGQLAQQMGESGRTVVFQALEASKTRRDLHQVIKNGERLGMEAFEVYRTDVDNPRCQAVLAEFQNR